MSDGRTVGSVAGAGTIARPAGMFKGAVARAVLGLLLVAPFGWGCAAKKTGNEPYVVAAREKDAQSQIRRLQERWELSSQTAKKELRPEIEEFIRRHAADPSADQARLMLAQLELLERRFGTAVDLLRPLIAGRPGRLRDEAQLVLASVEIRRGDFEAGLRRLAPLEGKLLSRSAEETFYRERITAALASRRWRLAVDSMQAWLKKQGEGGAADTRKWISEALLSVPAQALFRIVRPAEDGSIEEPVDEEERWLWRMMIERVAREALAQEDARLARDLVESAPPWLKTGEQGDSLLRLSSLAQDAAHITGRSLGFVLGGEDARARGRNLRVAAGILRAIREGAEQGMQVNYVTAEDRGSTAGALGALSGMGATYVVGGVDDKSARAALSFAKTRSVPTVVMTQPQGTWSTSPFGFVMGVSEQEQVQALAEDLSVGTAPVVVGGTEHDCASLTRQEMGSWLAGGATAVFFLGDAACLHLALTAAQPWKKPLLWGLGLESAAGPFPSGAEFYVLTSGAFPLSREVSQGSAVPVASEVADRPPGPNMGAAVDKNSEGSLRPLRAQGLDPEWDWYFTLGYDSANLLIQALLALPESAVSARDEVRAFAAAQTTLLTTEQRGFGGSRRIERQFSTRAVQSP